ncbi:MAG: hypothetical protein KatS3mg010_0897 [Acidimicrobiia bacterium]|nr:MAG: hypothetical protein KatS3mg010_0897 [Acidimicrobiia bacterium]
MKRAGGAAEALVVAGTGRSGGGFEAALLRVLEDQSPDMVLVVDFTGRLCYASPSIRRIGHEPGAVLGRDVFDFVHPDDAADARRSLATTARTPGEHEPLELRAAAADGTWHVVEVVATNLLDVPEIAGVVLRVRDVTNRHAQQRRFRLAFEQSPVPQAVWYPGEQGVIANRAFAELFGYTREELLSVAPADLVHPEDREAHRDAVRALVAGDLREFVAERRFCRKGGDWFHGRATTAAASGSDGVEYLFATVEDVTETRAAVAALAASEARFRALVDNSPDIVAILYPDGAWEASEQGTRLLGYPKGFDVDGGVFGLVHPDDVPRATAALEEVVAGRRGPDEPVEVRIRAADGNYLDFECVGQNLGDEHHVGGIVVTARNITTRKRLERAHAEASERLRTVFDHAPIAISLVDLEGRVIDVNPAACAMLGVPREWLVGQDAASVVHPDDIEIAMELTSRQLAGERIEAEFRLRREDGADLWVVSNATLYTPCGESEPFVITMQVDITQRRLVEDRLAHEATHDPLTGLLNRGAFLTHLELALARRGRGDVALLFIDLDHFKPVNDTLGHDAGDTVLVETAARLTAGVRGGDVVARLGGDEFVVLYQEVDSYTSLEAIVRRLMTALARPVEVRGVSVTVGASIGVATRVPGETATEMIRRADEAVYEAKRAGGAAFRLAPEPAGGVSRVAPRPTRRA